MLIGCLARSAATAVAVSTTYTSVCPHEAVGVLMMPAQALTVSFVYAALQVAEMTGAKVDKLRELIEEHK